MDGLPGPNSSKGDCGVLPDLTSKGHIDLESDSVVQDNWDPKQASSSTTSHDVITAFRTPPAVYSTHNLPPLTGYETGVSIHPFDFGDTERENHLDQDDILSPLSTSSSWRKKHSSRHSTTSLSLNMVEETPYGQRSFLDFGYSEDFRPQLRPHSTASRLKSYLGPHEQWSYPLEHQILAKRRGKEQGTPFSMKPYVNPLLGPSQASLISGGARFVPCMRLVEEVPIDMMLGCTNNTSDPPSVLCTIEELCGHGGFKNGKPNQWWRFIIPIFCHAGIVHLMVNMFVQCTVAAHVELEVGSVAFIIIYFSAGIFGNILGGNFALVGLPSVGASGAIFGTVGCMWVDLIAHWRYEHRPSQKLLMLGFELFFGIALGFLPGTDNFAHIGGFLLGLLSSIALYPIISETQKHAKCFMVVRGVAAMLGVMLIVVLLNNFYTRNPYSGEPLSVSYPLGGVKLYLSCIPNPMNDHCQGTGVAATD
ncbi:hypothetical protein FRB97_001472 [Tulasnella sp. 331]|nr:hypothetical protein FRB97_001472 [Tulasnella sp. 331]